MVPFKVDLSNKVVAITGAGGVLMREFAFAMAECGARVALLDINEQAAKEVAAKTLNINTSFIGVEFNGNGGEEFE